MIKGNYGDLLLSSQQNILFGFMEEGHTEIMSCHSENLQRYKESRCILSNKNEYSPSSEWQETEQRRVASPGVFIADKQREGYCTSRLPMGKSVQWHFYMTQEGINSQLTTHSILSPFVTCTFYKKFPAESYVTVYLKVLSMQLLSHRDTDFGCILRIQKSTSIPFFFPPQEKTFHGTSVSRRHILHIKVTASSFMSYVCPFFFFFEV